VKTPSSPAPHTAAVPPFPRRTWRYRGWTPGAQSTCWLNLASLPVLTLLVLLTSSSVWPFCAAAANTSVFAPFGLEPPAFSGSGLVCLPIHITRGAEVRLAVRSARLLLPGDPGLSHSPSSPLVILGSDGSGGWKRTWTFDVTQAPDAICVLDADRDGLEDLLCAIPRGRESVLAWYRQTESGGFAPPVKARLEGMNSASWIGLLDHTGRILVWSSSPDSGGIVLAVANGQLNPVLSVACPPELAGMEFSPFACLPEDSSGVILATKYHLGRRTVLHVRLGSNGWEVPNSFPRSKAVKEELVSLRRNGTEQVWYWPAARADTIFQVSAETGPGRDGLVLHPVPVSGLDPTGSADDLSVPSPIITSDSPVLLARALRMRGGSAAVLIEIGAEGGAHLRHEWPICPPVGDESHPAALLPPAGSEELDLSRDGMPRVLWQTNGAAFLLPLDAPPVPPLDLAFPVNLWVDVEDRAHAEVSSPLVDLTGDGRVDLLYEDENWEYQMRPGIGEWPWFGPARPITGIPEDVFPFAGAELDGAAGTDLVALNYGSSERFCVPLFWNGAGYRAGTAARVFTWGYPCVGDFDGDGRDEVLDPGNESTSFLRWDIDGAPLPRAPAYGLAARVFDAADFDGDGRDELIANPGIVSWQSADPATGQCGPMAWAIEDGWFFGSALQCVPDPPVEVCSQTLDTIYFLRAGARSTERHGKDPSADIRRWPGPPCSHWIIGQVADLQADGARVLISDWSAEPGCVAALCEPWADAHYEIGLLPEIRAGVSLYQNAGLHWTDLNGDGAEDLVVLRLDGIRMVMNPILNHATGGERRSGEGPDLRLLSPNPGGLPLLLAVRLRHPGEVMVSLFDAGGRQVYSQRNLVDTEAWSQVLVDPPSRASAKGVYWLRVRGEEGQVTRKVVVIR
jgi:hypothetical protein